MLDIDAIREDFALLEYWEDRYRYLIDLGRELSPYPDTARDEAHKVHGCASQVWLKVETGDGPDPIVTFIGDSDAHIVRGLVAVMIALTSGRRASEIAIFDPESDFRALGLDTHLSQQRANGLRAMVRRMKQEASRIAAVSA